MKKQIVMNVVYGVSAMLGLIAVGKGCKTMVNKYAKRDEESIDELIGEYEFVEEESE